MRLPEFADVTENLLKPALVAALNNPKVLPYFRSLSDRHTLRWLMNTHSWPDTGD